MKIALITSKYPRYAGTFDQREINGLRNAGADVHVFSIYPKDKKLFNDPKVFTTLEGKKPYWEKTHHINELSLNYLIGVLKFLVAFWTSKELMVAWKQYQKQGILSLAKYLYSIPKAFSWQLHGKDYEHVIAFWGNFSGTVGYFMARKLNLPFSTYLHAGTDLYRDRAFLLEKLLQSYKIISVCQFNINFLKETYPSHFNKFSNKIILHHLGLDLDQYDALPIPSNKGHFKLCCIGSLIESKGSLHVLKSFHQFIKSGYEGSLVYCGVGDLFDELKEYCLKNNIIDRVVFKGLCSTDEVNRTLQESHVLVHGSPYIGDAVPTVIKEAMAMARPVIATNIAGIPELVENNHSGLLVRPGDIKAMAEAMEYLYNNYDVAKKMGLLGRRIAEQKFDLWRNTSLLVDQLQSEDV